MCRSWCASTCHLGHDLQHTQMQAEYQLGLWLQRARLCDAVYDTKVLLTIIAGAHCYSDAACAGRPYPQS